MGRKERARYQNNDKVLELLKKDILTKEEREFIRKSYTGYGGLSRDGSAFGQFYTPEVVVEFIYDLLDMPPGKKVCEPSCGAGAFLHGLPRTAKIHACELSYEAYNVATRIYPNAHILQGDGLEYLKANKNNFDYVVGNPPYGKAIPADSRFANKSGNAIPEIAFVEAAFDSLVPGGTLAMVVPDGILSASAHLKFRKWMIEEAGAYLRAVISLPPETFYFSGTSVKTSVLMIEKKQNPKDKSNYSVFMALAQHIGWDSRGRETGKNDLPAILNEWWEYIEQQHDNQEQVVV